MKLEKKVIMKVSDLDLKPGDYANIKNFNGKDYWFAVVEDEVIKCYNSQEATHLAMNTALKSVANHAPHHKNKLLLKK